MTVLFEDILTGMRVNLKRKRVVSENEDKVVVKYLANNNDILHSIRVNDTVGWVIYHGVYRL